MAWLFAIPMILTGCGFPPPSPAISDGSELIGTWVAVADGESASIELIGDGTAQLESIPLGAVSPALVDQERLDWSVAVTTTGKWTITDHRTSGYPYVNLIFEPSEEEGFDGAMVRLLVDKNHHPARVFLQYGPERESRLSFEKRDE
ncbi:MAG: hypothetical protein DI534_05225 [Leifsonia xyli]|nr:MAG: hypothetical protein DI534_05225 [Leifsonia xyli]